MYAFSTLEELETIIEDADDNIMLASCTCLTDATIAAEAIQMIIDEHSLPVLSLYFEQGPFGVYLMAETVGFYIKEYEDTLNQEQIDELNEFLYDDSSSEELLKKFEEYLEGEEC